MNDKRKSQAKNSIFSIRKAIRKITNVSSDVVNLPAEIDGLALSIEKERECASFSKEPATEINDPLFANSAAISLDSPSTSSVIIESINDNIPIGIDINDFGYLIGQEQNDSDRLKVLNSRCVPKDESEFPVLYHTKNGKIRPRSINLDILEKFNWVAITKHPDHKGRWCVFCILFGTL